MRKAGLLCAAAWLAASVLRGDGPGTTVATAPEPTPTPTPAKAIEYIPMRGFAFRTPDGLFELAIGFNFQFRYTWFDFDQVPGATPNADEFRVRRFKLYLTGFAYDPRLTYRFQAAFENVANGKLLLDDAWLNYKFMEELAVQGGQSKTPYSREEIYNDGVVQFTERATAVDAFKPGRDIGAGAFGSFSGGVFNYAVGIFGGDGQTTLRATQHVMPMLRLVFNPIGQMGQGEVDLEGHAKPALSFGVDGFNNTLQKLPGNTLESNIPSYASATGWLGRHVGLFETGENIFIESASADVQFKWRGLSIQGEYFWGRAEGKTSKVILRAEGWYAQADYFILPHKLDLGVRYSSVEPNRAVSNDVNAVFTAAPTWYFKGNNLKMQLDYSRTRRQRSTGAPANDQLLRLQVQFML